MTYETLAGLRSRFGETALRQFSDRNGHGQIDTDNINRALAAADATIDSYLRGRYQLPLAGTFAELADIAGTLAWYSIAGERMTEEWRVQYQTALKALREYGDGTRQLAIPGTAATAAPSTNVITCNRRQRRFIF